jgi:hypothetical protein
MKIRQFFVTVDRVHGQKSILSDVSPRNELFFLSDVIQNYEIPNLVVFSKLHCDMLGGCFIKTQQILEHWSHHHLETDFVFFI